jgi:oxaloacetate decarboxylase gamma subunit
VESEQLLSDALTLMALGMGTVFVFLTILVFVTGMMSSLVSRFAPASVPPSAPPAAPSAGADQSTLAAISAAIYAHRSRR